MVYLWKGRLFFGCNAASLLILVIIILSVIDFLLRWANPRLVVDVLFIFALLYYPKTYRITTKWVYCDPLNFIRWGDIEECNATNGIIFLRKKGGRVYRIPGDDSGWVLEIISMHLR